MTDGLGLRQGTLELRPHDPRWPSAFARLRAELSRALPPIGALHHIGSTAVPGLEAKPILDIGAVAPEAEHDRIAAILVGLGWQDRGLRSGRLFVRTAREVRTHNLHLYAPGSRELADQLRLRDLLRADPDLRSAYAAEKRRIVARGTPRRDYADAKTAFIRAALGAGRCPGGP